MNSRSTRYPGHAYVPGKTPRHAEGAFDAVRSTAKTGMGAEDLIGSEAFETGLDFLQNGFYWEAHEVLEPVWLALPEQAPERSVVQGIIQLANAQLKIEMGRPKAALRLCNISEALLGGGGHSPDCRIDVKSHQARIRQMRQMLKEYKYNA